MKRRVAIIGGGLAGIAAAVRVAEQGAVPIVVETRPRLGGRATSLVDPRTGRVVDNCQHVLMGCCTNLIDLYDRLGVLDDIQWHDTFYWTRGDGGDVHALRSSRLPAPFHLAPGFARLGLFDREGRRAIRRAMWRIIRLGPAGRLKWRERTFREFLEAQDQPPGVIDDFWGTVIVSACNLDVGRVSAETALHVFQEGFLANRWSYTMGLSAAPLAALYDPAVEHVEAHGGDVLLGTSARAIVYDGKRVAGIVTGDGVIEAAAVISAVPFDRLDRLISDTMRQRDTRLQALDRFEVSPILGVHLLFDRQIMELPHLTIVGRGVQWLFNKGVDHEGVQHLHAVISAADEWMELSEDEITARVMSDVHAVLPGSVGLEPIDARSIKEKRATFAATPGIEAIRPPAEPVPVGVGGGGIENLFLAGDWCDTGWPATMEGAVRSGYQAAKAVTGEGGLVADVPPGLLARVLGL